MPRIPHCATVLTILMHFVAGAPGCNVLVNTTSPESRSASASNAASTSGPPTGSSGNAPDVEHTLASDDWVERFEFSNPDPAPTATVLRWRHAGLESVLSGDDARKRLRAAMRSSDAMVARNAAIGLSYLDEAGMVTALVEIAQDSETKLPMRGAAIEALGRLTTSKSDDALVQLNEQYGDFRGKAQARYLPELHADLIRAMACRPASQHETAIRQAMASPAPAVRLEAARAYRDDGASPHELVDLAADGSAAVRAAAIRALAASRHIEAQMCLARALDDYDLTVRLAAVESLAYLPGNESAKQLVRLAQSTSDVIRAAAVRSLAARGDSGAVLKAAGDKSWRVRAAAAESFKSISPEQRFALSRELLDDASLEVQRTLIKSAANWSMVEAVPLWLEAAASRSASTRRLAVESLQARWPVAADLSSTAPISPRFLNELARLRSFWQQEHGESTHKGAANGPNVLPAQAFDARELNEVAKLLDRLESGPPHDRRGAARQLAQNYQERPLPDSALVRLRNCMERETDALVLSDGLTLVGADQRPAAAEIAAIAASHPAAEVRRRACAYFGRHPGRSAAQALVNCLADDNSSVLREAVRALAAQPPDEVGELAPLERLLTSADGELVVEAATTLVALGSQAGFAALLRAAYHRDTAARRLAAVALGKALRDEPDHPRLAINKTQRQEAMAELVRLLDDRGEVRRAALASLEQIAGQPQPIPVDSSAGNPRALPLQDDAQINRWKAWLREQR